MGLNSNGPTYTPLRVLFYRTDSVYPPAAAHTFDETPTETLHDPGIGFERGIRTGALLVGVLYVLLLGFLYGRTIHLVTSTARNLTRPIRHAIAPPPTSR